MERRQMAAVNVGDVLVLWVVVKNKAMEEMG